MCYEPYSEDFSGKYIYSSITPLLPGNFQTIFSYSFFLKRVSVERLSLLRITNRFTKLLTELILNKTKMKVIESTVTTSHGSFLEIVDSKTSIS